MSDFLRAYHLELRKKNLSPSGLSVYAAILADVIGDWFRRYGEQAAGDREAGRLARKATQEDLTALREKLGRMDARLFQIEHHGVSE